MGGGYNTINAGVYAGVTAGYGNTINNDYGSAIGGLNTVNHTNAHIIGSNITSIAANTTHVEGLNIGTIGNNESLNNILVRDTDGTVSFRSAQSIAGSFTGNTSGDCITDLFVSNIHSCSPLNINPLDEGNVYFGSTSGVTIDVINKRLGINTLLPNYNVEVFNDDLTTSVRFDLTPTIKRIGAVSTTSTGLTEFFASTNYPSLGGYGSFSMGIIGESAVVSGIVPERGVSGDTYIYTSARANGLNIINKENPSGTEDYIRFYAGQDANGTTPDIHIQGSGATRGFVGLNNETPQERLDVNGNSIINGTLNVKNNIITEGSVTRNTRTVDSGGDPTLNDNDHIVFYTTGLAGGTITLPAAVAGREIILIRTGGILSANVSGLLGALINGLGIKVLPTTLYSTITLISDGTDWYATSATVL